MAVQISACVNAKGISSQEARSLVLLPTVQLLAKMTAVEMQERRGGAAPSSNDAPQPDAEVSPNDEALRESLVSDVEFHLARTLVQVPPHQLPLSFPTLVVQRKGDMRQLTLAYMSLFQDQFLDMLTYMINAEISNVSESQAAELMRGNTPTMKMLCEFAYAVGTDYFRDVLDAPLTDLFQLPHSLEVNTQLVTDAAMLAANQQTLEAFAQAILDRLVATAASFPPALARLCHFLRRSVAVRFHAHTDAALGGYLFLRVLCPIIVMPYHSVVFPTLDKASVPSHALRSSILVAKLLQNLANNALFKEEYMTVFNPFIRRNFATVVDFYDRLCAVDASPTHALPPRPYSSPSLLSTRAALEIVRDRIATGPVATATHSSPPLTSSSDMLKADPVTLSLDRQPRKHRSDTGASRRFFFSQRGVPDSRPEDVGLLSQVHYVEMAHRGLQSLLAALSDTTESWQVLQHKHGVPVRSRVRRGIFELEATVVIHETPDAVFNFIASPAGREIWSTWGQEVRELEQVDRSSRLVHATNFGAKSSFFLWCCMQLQDACELETGFSPSPEGVHCHALLFQSVGRPDVPLVPGVVRSHLYSSGFVVRPSSSDDLSSSTVTFSIRMEEDLMPLQAKPYQKEVATLGKLKLALERQRNKKN
ncbi:Aste57867_14944 [Aphanomyces stellatus]|uniref:Aste57867_14944 protein n=1 Tax=Aphanomyces stellatus TaxID=120398 RepID=A0A485L1Z6_9STRA|nr:hypothetical protein As57867_014888 [Aphanomyces stellatus]VFT91758.1 Aste57867_14944 [Aphanomyces stellatus]